MMQDIAVWLSCFSIMIVCFLPMVSLHLFFVNQGSFYRISILVQKTLSLFLLIVPFFLFASLGQGPLGVRVNFKPNVSIENAKISSASTGLTQTLTSEYATSGNLSIADLWFPFVGLIFVSTLFGILLFVVRIFLQERALRKCQVGAIENADHGISIFTNKEIKVPFSVGILRKRIFLPAELQGREREVILSHEINHCFLNHHTWSLLEAFQTHLFWFNPLAHILRKTGNGLREIECDEFSTRNIDRFEYLKTLIATAEKFSMVRVMPIRGQGWNHVGGLKVRISNLIEQRQTKRIALWVGIFVAIILLSLGGTFYFASHIDSATEDALLRDIQTQYANVRQSREMVNIEQVPKHFIDALLIHEDQAFFDHDGISIKAIGRATSHNLASVFTGGPAFVQGGSTLTQQLAKQFLQDNKRSIGRKFREYKLAHVLESHFSKKEILAMYLNIVYFGNQTAGLAQASQFYYHTAYDKLTAEQSAMLVPFLDAPTKYNMIANPEVAEQRKSQLLTKLNQSVQ